MVSKASDDLPLPAQARDDRKRLVRYGHVDILEVVDARACNLYAALGAVVGNRGVLGLWYII